ncbi:MAG: SDR family oxidoreductase [Candidatus Hydrogenedentota bacterium]|nr:MAG: SDR family oxidoreductase [Candidatus Hydrogenedentota bacterium]
MNILITGGLGYVGGRLAVYLKRTHPEINLYVTTRKPPLEKPPWAAELEILQLNVVEEEAIKQCLENNIDVIVHLAALNELVSFKAPEAANEVNTMGTYKLLKHAKEKQIKKFIFFSTIHVYGAAESDLIDENTPTKPFHPYAITHLAAENYARFFHRYHGVQTLILRLSNGYGYPMDKNVDRWTLVFNDLCRQAVTCGRMVIKSKGQYRDFISLHNVARAVEHFIFKRPNDWKDGLFNLGGDNCLSIAEVGEKIAEVYKSVFGKSVKIEINKNEDDDRISGRFRYSIDKLVSTGFELEENMEEEIMKTLLLCKEFLI